MMEMPFDRFVFPACRDCNERFSRLEGTAKSVVVRMLQRQPLAALELDLLLDWLDKIRVGLWLGIHQQLDKNRFGVSPHFHIADRIGNADRLVLIYRSDQDQRGINFSGVSLPAFAHIPSCFGLRINDLHLLNVSHQFMLSRAFGMPYPERWLLDQNVISDYPYDLMMGRLCEGTGVISASAIDIPYDPNCTAIAQPMISDQSALVVDDELRWASAYQPEHSDDLALDARKGKPYLIEHGQATAYPSAPSKQWIPAYRHEVPDFTYQFAIWILHIQNCLIARTSFPADMAGAAYSYRQCTLVSRLWLKSLTEHWLRLHGRDLGATPRNAPCPCGSGAKYKHCCGDHRLAHPERELRVDPMSLPTIVDRDELLGGPDET
ncbi:MAG: SEC-C domain-containing protein [Anaerolineales bacterium]|nr:SEC-C domain-containing protein [Anaerolineales bacterium]